MNESRNRFFFPAVGIVLAIAFFKAMNRGRLSGFLLEQGLILLVAGAVVGTLVWSDRCLRKRHSTEWMARYYKWVFGGLGAAGLIFVAALFRRAGLQAKREGEFGAAALTILSMAAVIGTIVGMDMFFRKRRSDQWMNGFRICMALVVVALLTGVGAYLLSMHPSAGRLQAGEGDAVFKPIALVGWNADVVFEKVVFAPFSKATSFDWPEQRGADYPLYAWFEAGLKGHADGFPQGRRFTSAADTNVLFELQPYNTKNVLLLTSLKPTGTLVLTEPAVYRSLFILTAAGGGDGEGNLQLHFSDRTDSDLVLFRAPDWSASYRQPRAPRTPALGGLGRSNGKQRFKYEDWQRIQGDTGFALYQAEIDLKALDVQRKAVQSITFKKAGGSVTVGIFAISGDRSPSSDFPTIELER